MIDVKQFLANYSKNNREPFNEALFVRSEDDIIENVQKVILSITNRDDFPDSRFLIKVNYFNVIKDYRKVKEILFELESKGNRRNKRVEHNIHEYINLKDSDVILLEVNYHCEVNGTSADGSVFIDIPKVINKYYFRIAGTIYSTLYQIADASTYNNAQNKKRDRHISFRQVFQKYNVYEKKTKVDLWYIDANTFELMYAQEPCISYTIDLFGNNIPICKYFLASFGYEGALRYLQLPDIHITLGKPFNGGESEYVYLVKDDIWISVPRYFWANSPVVQSFMYCVYLNLPKKCENIEEILSRDYWLAMLGSDFKSKSIEKGQSMLDSVMRNYDISMQEELRLPDDQKRNLIDIFRWEMYEFEALYQKDNYDMTYKKLKITSYIAGFYASKLSYNLINASKSINSLTAEKLLKSLNIPHEYILDSIKKKGNLITYKNNVNDDDIFSVLKYTFKGESGIGENKASAIPVKYRLANPSHIGKVDCDTSPAGDPGMTGLICPYAEIGVGNYLAEYKEPCNWREVQEAMMDDYRRITSMRSVFQTKEELLGSKAGKDLLMSLESAIKNLLQFTVGTDIYD
jgi:hypothetical protein